MGKETSFGIPSGAGFAVAAEVADALAEGHGVVALESTIISHGLPTDSSAAIARQIESTVRKSGAVPATIALLDGQVRVGLDDAALERIATDEAVVKASIRDLAVVLSGGGAGATTVASTAYLASRCGISVFATGGLGGVHRGAAETWDESADLLALARVPITVICAGVKSILDVPATLERLETLSVSLVGYGTDAFPGFYVRDSGFEVPWRLDSAEQIAAVMARRSTLGLDAALVVANPIPEADEIDRELHDRTLKAGLAALADAGVRGKDVTPYLLAFFHEQTQGRSLDANVALVLNNARLAGEIAMAACR
ncbi:MAG: pseudouridine-5'-phosphate glycosidase [Nocardioidaceae bacterium]